MKSVVRLTIALLISFVVSVRAAERVKPRVIATTDGELDDKSSMVRFLMYATSQASFRSMVFRKTATAKISGSKS